MALVSHSTNQTHTMKTQITTTTKAADATQSVSVGYAYASSISADRHSFPGGCWIVETIQHGQCIGERGFAAREDAFDFADSLSLPFFKYSVAR